MFENLAPEKVISYLSLFITCLAPVIKYSPDSFESFKLSGCARGSVGKN